MTPFPQRPLLTLLAGLMLSGAVMYPAVAADSLATRTAEVTTQVTKPIYPWRTETQKKPQTEQFSHCLVKNMYDNGILLLLAENDKHQRRLAIHFPQDKLVANDSYGLEWQVDRQAPQQVNAIAATPRILAIALDESMTKQIARGNMLFLRGPNDALVFDMKGVNDAVSSLADCLTVNGVSPAGAAYKPPVAAFVPPQATTQQAPHPVTPVPQPITTPPVATPVVTAPPVKPTAIETPKSIPATEALSSDIRDLFTRAGLPPKSVMRVPDTERDDKPFDAIWNSGDLFVGIKSEPPIPHQALTQAASRFSKLLQTICGGEFLAEGGAVEKRGNRYVMPAEIACSQKTSDTKTPNTVAALLLVLDTRTLQTYFIEAPERLGSQAVSARDALQAQIK